MTIHPHLQVLHQKHQALEEKIEKAHAWHEDVTELKRQKLKIKDDIKRFAETLSLEYQDAV